MVLSSRQDAYRLVESTGFLGRIAILICSGGFAHRFTLESRDGRVDLFYEGLAA